MYKASGVEDDGAETVLTLLESSSKEKIKNNSFHKFQ